ncbi:MAG TPA: thioredoxin [bacterium]|nr:thioredoxin [bacterium]
MPTITVTDTDFQENVISPSHTQPVLVDFYAPWCGPCQMMSPILDNLAEEMGNAAVIAKINVDENLDKASEYQIMSIPNLKIFKNGEIVEEISGMSNVDHLKELLQKYL